jgi:hypothetical protein
VGLNKAGRAGLAALIIVMIVASAAIVLWSRGRRANADLSNQALNHEQPAPEVLTNSPATSPLAIPTLPNTPTPEGTTTPTPAESPGPPQESAATGPDYEVNLWEGKWCGEVIVDDEQHVVYMHLDRY